MEACDRIEIWGGIGGGGSSKLHRGSHGCGDVGQGETRFNRALGMKQR